MGDSVPCLRPGFLSALQWPTFISPSLSTPRPACERDPEDVPGILQQGPRGRLPSQQLPDPAWLAPEDLQKPFTPQSRVEDALKHWAAHHAEEPIPRPLLRELLEGDLAVGQLAAGVNLLGSRLAAARAGGRLVVASVCGRIGEELSVAVLAADGSGEFQCVARMRAACAGMPIQQLCFQSCPAGVGPDDQGPLLLAARAHSWLCFHEVVPPRQPGLAEGGSGAEQPWELRAVGALKVRQRLAHVAWHRALPGLAAFALEDGSLRTVEARPEAAQRDGQERVHIGLLGGAFPALRPDMLAGPLEAPPRARRARLLCEWAAHPTSLLLAAGATLQCYHLRRPGQAASAPRVLHRLAPDDAFVALACPVSGGGSAAYTGGQSSSFPHLLAASTLREVLLLDLRRPGRALLKWAHGQSRDPPALLALLHAPPPAPGAPGARSDPDLARGQPPTDPIQQRAGQRTPQAQQRSALGSEAGPSDPRLQQQQQQPGGRGPPQELRTEDIVQSQFGSSSQLPAEGAPVSLERGHGIAGAEAFGTQASQAPPGLAAQASQAQQPAHAAAGEDGAAAAAAGASGREAPWTNCNDNNTLEGFVVAGSLGSGDVLSFAFSLASPEVRLFRQPAAAGGGGGAVRSAAGDPAGAPSSSRVSVQRLGPGASGHAEPVQAAAGGRGPSGRSGSRGGGGAEGAAGFTWAPLNLCGARSAGLPRRACWPLAQPSGEPPGLRAASEPEQARELEAALSNAPDLAGMALLPGAPLAPRTVDGSSRDQPQGREGGGSVLLLRLGFLGDVAVDRIRTPWEMRRQSGRHEAPDLAAAASLGGLQGPRHAGAVPEYTIRCPPDQEEAGSREPASHLQAPSAAQGRRGKGADVSELICDVSVHRGIAARAARSWAAALSSGVREDPPEVQRALQGLLAEMQAQNQVPLTVWEVTQELGHFHREVGSLSSLPARSRPALGPSARPACSPGPAQASGDGGASALQRRVRSVRRGAPAAGGTGGTASGGGGDPPPQPPRLPLWQKARGTDPANIAGERLRAAHREREGALGLPGRVASASAALAALLAPDNTAGAPPGGAGMPAIGPAAAGAGFALRSGLRLPPAGGAPARHVASAGGPAAEGAGLGSQATTASQPSASQGALPIGQGPLVEPRGWSGCGSVMVPLQPAQRMFGGTAAASPALEPRLVMGPIQAGDAAALERLTALEDKWLAHDGEQGLSSMPAENDAHAPEQEPASQSMQAAPQPRPGQRGAPQQAQQHRAHTARSPTATAPPRPKRPAKKRRTVLQEGFS